MVCTFSFSEDQMLLVSLCMNMSYVIEWIRKQNLTRCTLTSVPIISHFYALVTLYFVFKIMI
jgi:hypothetical protein